MNLLRTILLNHAIRIEIMMRLTSTAVAVVTMVAGGCDSRRTVRTTIRSEPGGVISEQCIHVGLEESGQWELQPRSADVLTVFPSRPDGPSFTVSLGGEDQTSVVTIDAAMIIGKSDESQHLRELEAAERSVATAILKRCTSRGRISCWDSKTRVESARCFD